MAVFAAISFTPIIFALAFSVFSIFLLIATCLVALVGIGITQPSRSLPVIFINSTALCLVVSLAAALLSSVLLGAAFHFLRAGGGLSRTRTVEIHAEPPYEAPAPLKGPSFFIPHLLSAAGNKAVNAVLSPLRRIGRRKKTSRLLILILLSEAISRLHLPRAVRYNLIYRTIFGPQLFGPGRRHPLQWILSRPFFLLRTVRFVPILCVGLVQLPLRIVGWKAPLAIYLTLFVLSPRTRGSTRRAIARLSVRVSTAVTTAVVLVWQAVLRDRTWNTAAAAADYAKEAARAILVVFVAFLRTQLEKLEEQPTPAAAVPAQAEEATYEMIMVPPAVPVEASGSASGSGSQASGSASGSGSQALGSPGTLRRVSARVAEEN
ncbi:hypothetical protein GGX14DRAFT_572654 [Mycena pura]|uniref:Uncharacterized protein n=1 Tax=Mycena pura TaxID=153505 RepID=A0AAD6V3C2_9AGAR|nr:hypothetical protein GGX14DRAFT_572654 [Mycena pura]